MRVEDALFKPELDQAVLRRESLCEYFKTAKMTILKAAKAILLLPALGSGLVTNRQNEVSAPVATVKNGTYQGRYEPAYGTDYFLGMPFAQPPVGM